MEDGYVAFLDVLGFAATVQGHDATGRIARYRKSLESALSGRVISPSTSGEPYPGAEEGRPPPEQGTPLPLKASVFSDSIILAMPSTTQESLRDLLTHTSRLFNQLLNAGIALRGAIAYGPYECAEMEVGTFFAGPAITDAYRFEAAQDWVGIMLSPSVVDRNHGLDELCDIGMQAYPGAPPFRAGDPEEQVKLRARIKWASILQRCNSIPFHSNNWFDVNTYDGFAVVPTNGEVGSNALRQNLTKCLQVLERLKSVAPDPRAQKKYDHTVQWLRRVAAQWDQIAAGEKHLLDQGKLQR